MASFDHNLRVLNGTVLRGLIRGKLPQILPLIRLFTKYDRYTDIGYAEEKGAACKLDVYLPVDEKPPFPTVIHFHGGGWSHGRKENNLQLVTPYLESHYAVVCADYRLAGMAPAPAAVEDACRVLVWIVQNHLQYGFSIRQIILAGDSAGGHLALMTAFLPHGSALHPDDPLHQEYRIKAVVNWYGITDVTDLIDGPNRRDYAVEWMTGTDPNKSLARTISPVTHVRQGLPAVLTFHGDADPVVPFAHAERLHNALSDVRVPNELRILHGGGHGSFSSSSWRISFDRIRHFLDGILAG